MVTTKMLYINALSSVETDVHCSDTMSIVHVTTSIPEALGNDEAAAAAAEATDPTNGGRPLGILDPLCRGAGLAATDETIGTGGVPMVLLGGVIGDVGTAARTIASRCSRLCFR